MIINAKRLIGLAVKTKSQVSLGRVYDFELDADKGEIVRFYVSNSSIIKNLLQSGLIIDMNQVVEISEKEMTVDDSVQKIKSEEFASI